MIKEFNMNTWYSVIQVKNYKNENITICALYHSPNASDAEFMNIISELGEDMVEHSKVLIIGDFNININIKDDYYVKKLISIMYSYGFKQYVQEYTRITDRSSTIIDLAFANFQIVAQPRHTPKITDHSMLIIKTELQAINVPRQK